MNIKELLASRKIPFEKDQADRVSRAFEFARKAHLGQVRKSGEEYFDHCVQTAAILSKMGLGSITVSAALLHDTYEDTSVTLGEIEKEFGKEVAFVVQGVSKLSKVQLKGSLQAYYLDNLRKMFLAMAADIRVVLIKLADRLHNMRTLYALPREKQQRIAKETMEIFVPIANRFGIGELKREMEDLCFKYLDPENFRFVHNLQEEQYQERQKYVKEAIRELGRRLKQEQFKVIDIHGRAKSLHSLYLKLKRHDMNIEKIYDLEAIRIIVPTIADCYETLGIVHKSYRPLIGRIKDYISLPKPNGYKSIHTTVFGPHGRIIEIQIRTERMHDEAEYGIAAHWIYSYKKEKKSWKDILWISNHKPKVPDEELGWVKQLREWHRETGGGSDEFWSSIKIDFFKNHIFAFTPQGDVVELPEGATPVDFAYTIHSEVGNRMVGVKIGGKMVSLDTVIHNGDLVEVMTAKEKKLPNRDWLEFAKTANAKSKIKSALRKGGVEAF